MSIPLYWRSSDLGISTLSMTIFSDCLGHATGQWILTVFVSRRGSICRYEICQFGSIRVFFACPCTSVCVSPFCTWKSSSYRPQTWTNCSYSIWFKRCPSLRSGPWQLLYSIYATCKKERNTLQCSGNIGAGMLAPDPHAHTPPKCCAKKRSALHIFER